MGSASPKGLNGLRVVSFESRRATEIAEVIRRYGGEPIVAPSMREVPLSENTAPLELFDKISAGQIDILILLTGVGTQTMVEALAGRYSREEIAALLGTVTIVARGPKPVAALKELGLRPAMTAPEPNTWKEVLAVVDSNLDLHGKHVAVQEYGMSNQELLAALETRGANVLRVPVYRWALPEDIGPLQATIKQITDGRVDAVLFTSATQIEHVFKVAQENRTEGDLKNALTQVIVGSIGPVCTEALTKIGLVADLEPEHPKMGHLVGELAQRGRELLEKKRLTQNY